MDSDQLYLSSIIKPLLTAPFTIDRTEDDMGVLLTLSIDQADMGRVIGKGGETVKAIRLILNTFGFKTGGPKVSLKINDPK